MPSESSREAERPIGWAIIGASAIAEEFMIEAIRQTGGVPHIVVSGDGAYAKTYAERNGIAGHTTSLAEALSDDRIGAVYIGSANSKHHEQVIAAAKAGKHILCDKPLATKLTDAGEMVRACEEAGVVLAVNHHLRASRLHQEMRRMIADGAIGDVRSVMIVHAGYLREKLQTWRITDPAEGAIYLDLSVHDIDLARFLLQQDPLAAAGMGKAFALGRDEIHDHAVYAVTMSGGALLQVQESFVTPHAESQVLALGSKGVLLATGTIGQKAQGRLIRRTGAGEETLSIAQVDLYQETVHRFLEAIARRGEPLATGRDGAMSLAAAQAVAASVSSGRSIKVEPVA